MFSQEAFKRLAGEERFLIIRGSGCALDFGQLNNRASLFTSHPLR